MAVIRVRAPDDVRTSILVAAGARIVGPVRNGVPGVRHVVPDADVLARLPFARIVVPGLYALLDREAAGDPAHWRDGGRVGDGVLLAECRRSAQLVKAVPLGKKNLTDLTTDCEVLHDSAVPQFMTSESCFQ